MPDLNKRLLALTHRYGRVTVDFFCDGQWRLWFQDFHQHRGLAMHGGLTAHGSTPEQALDRLEASIREYPPNEGFHCTRTCPHYTEDLY